MRWLMALGLVGVLVTSITVAAERTWTDSSGKFSVQAEFVSADEGTVQLKKQSGEVIGVPLTRLSEEDQRYVGSETFSANASGRWITPEGTVFEIEDRAGTFSVSVTDSGVLSRFSATVHREGSKLVASRCFVVFANDPSGRSRSSVWELEVGGDGSGSLTSSVIVWNSFGQETERGTTSCGIRKLKEGEYEELVAMAKAARKKAEEARWERSPGEFEWASVRERAIAIGARPDEETEEWWKKLSPKEKRETLDQLDRYASQQKFDKAVVIGLGLVAAAYAGGVYGAIRNPDQFWELYREEFPRSSSGENGRIAANGTDSKADETKQESSEAQPKLPSGAPVEFMLKYRDGSTGRIEFDYNLGNESLAGLLSPAGVTGHAITDSQGRYTIRMPAGVAKKLVIYVDGKIALDVYRDIPTGGCRINVTIP